MIQDGGDGDDDDFNDVREEEIRGYLCPLSRASLFIVKSIISVAPPWSIAFMLSVVLWCDSRSARVPHLAVEDGCRRANYSDWSTPHSKI